MAKHSSVGSGNASSSIDLAAVNARIEDLAKVDSLTSDQATEDASKSILDECQRLIREAQSISTGNSNDKVSLLMNKISDLQKLCTKAAKKVNTERKRVDQKIMERAEVASELEKERLLRSKIENLCRDVTKKAKESQILQENEIRLERERYAELSTSFQEKLTGFMKSYDQQIEHQKTIELERVENQKKYSTLVEQYERREIQFVAELRKMDIEGKLARADGAQKAALAAQQLERAMEIDNRCRPIKEENDMLRGQLKDIAGMGSSFEKTINQYKDLLEKVSQNDKLKGKKIEEQIKEINSLKENMKMTQAKSILYYDDLEKSKGEITTLTRKLENLETLCRNLTLERHDLLKKISNQGSQNSVE